MINLIVYCKSETKYAVSLPPRSTNICFSDKFANNSVFNVIGPIKTRFSLKSNIMIIMIHTLEVMIKKSIKLRHFTKILFYTFNLVKIFIEVFFYVHAYSIFVLDVLP